MAKGIPYKEDDTAATIDSSSPKEMKTHIAPDPRRGKRNYYNHCYGPQAQGHEMRFSELEDDDK